MLFTTSAFNTFCNMQKNRNPIKCRNGFYFYTLSTVFVEEIVKRDCKKTQPFIIKNPIKYFMVSMYVHMC